MDVYEREKKKKRGKFRGFKYPLVPWKRFTERQNECWCTCDS